MHADIARQAFELAREFEQQLDVVFPAFALRQNRLRLHRVNRLVVALAAHWRQLQTDADTGLVRNEFADAVAKGVTHVEHAPDVTDHGARRHGSERDDLADRVLAVLLFHIINHPVAIALAEINVEVGHGNPLRIEKALEQQVVLQRIQIGNLEGIGHQGAGTGAAPGPDRTTVLLGPVDEITNDQKIARKAHLQDRVDLEFQPFDIASTHALAFGLHRIAAQQSLTQPQVRGVAKVGLRCHLLAIDLRYREVRQLRLVKDQCQVAAPGNLPAVLQCRRQIGKQRLHLRGGLEILLTREPSNATLVAQDFALGDADPGLVRLKIVSTGELYRVRGHHRQAHAGRQLNRGHHMPLVICAPGALQLQIKTMWKNTPEAQRRIAGACLIARKQGLPDRSGLRTRKRDQSFAQFRQPIEHDQGLRLAGIAGPGPRQQFGQVQIALPVLYQ